MNDLKNQITAAFEKAIKQGRLSLDKNSDNYVGDYMYMGKNSSGFDAFKNSITRCYIK
tara:strand:+ start:175 stop:348 length:174 start_codon:yes stop_codon:yes gene_type:complete